MEQSALDSSISLACFRDDFRNVQRTSCRQREVFSIWWSTQSGCLAALIILALLSPVDLIQRCTHGINCTVNTKHETRILRPQDSLVSNNCVPQLGHIR